MVNKIENIAFCGGGVRIIAEIGACKVLEEKGVLKSVKRLAGTSAGAIVSTMIALGYSYEEMRKMAMDLDFTKFEDGGILEKANIVNDFGIHKGQTFLEFIQDKIEGKTGSKYSTFAGLKAKGMKDLTVFACNLNTQSLKIFNFEHTPNVSIADAVRCSMSIPLFFEVHMLPKDNNIYVDGGTIYNYPISFFPSDTTIGVCFDSYRESQDNSLRKGQFKKYIEGLLACVGNSQSINLQKNTDQLSRSIVIHTNGISAIKFDLTNQDKELMLNSGINAATQFFK